MTISQFKKTQAFKIAREKELITALEACIPVVERHNKERYSRAIIDELNKACESAGFCEYYGTVKRDPFPKVIAQHKAGGEILLKSSLFAAVVEPEEYFNEFCRASFNLVQRGGINAKRTIDYIHEAIAKANEIIRWAERDMKDAEDYVTQVNEISKQVAAVTRRHGDLVKIFPLRADGRFYQLN